MMIGGRHINIHVAILLSILLLSCSSDPQLPSGGVSGATSSTLSIAAFKALYISGSQRLTDVVFIKGSITANDYMGEFSDTLVIEDDTGAIEVCVDIEELFNVYMIGCEVTINCTNLWIGSEGGALLLGGEPTGDYAVDTLELDDFASCTTVNYDGVTARTPTKVTISQLTAKLVSCYVQISDLSFLTTLDDDGNEVDTFCALNSETGQRLSTTHTLEERATGSQVSLYVSSSVDYANELLPTGTGTIYAILSSYGSYYSLRVVSHGFTFDGIE